MIDHYPFLDPYEDILNPECMDCRDSGLFSAESGLLIPCSCPQGKYYRDQAALKRLQEEFNTAMLYGDFLTANELKDQIDQLQHEK